MSIDVNGKTCQQNVKQYKNHYSTQKYVDVGPVSSASSETYIYNTGKEKKMERGELLRSAGKNTNKPKTPNMICMQQVSYYTK